MENIILCEILFLSHKTDCSDSGLGRAQAWIEVVKGYFEEEVSGKWEDVFDMILAVLAWGAGWESSVSHGTRFLS